MVRILIGKRERDDVIKLYVHARGGAPSPAKGGLERAQSVDTLYEL